MQLKGSNFQGQSEIFHLSSRPNSNIFFEPKGYFWTFSKFEIQQFNNFAIISYDPIYSHDEIAISGHFGAIIMELSFFKGMLLRKTKIENEK